MSADEAPPQQPRPPAELSREDRLWQRRLLPFMIGSLVFVTLAFLVATFWFFSDLQNRLDFKQTDVLAPLTAGAVVKPDQIDHAYRDWYVRAGLEQAALHQRFNVQTTVVKARLWTRLMGFMTGMLLAMTGCVFVLGKLRESIDFRADGKAGSTALVTSSPGVFLALLGTIVIGMSLAVQVTVESTDAAVYLPKQVQTLPGTPAEARPEPAKLPPASSPSGANGAAPPMPKSVADKLEAMGKGAAGQPGQK